MLIFTVFIVVLVTYLYVEYGRRYRLGSRFPGPFAIPFIGNFQYATLSAERLFLKLSEIQTKHQRYFRLWLGPNLWLFLNHPEDVEKILNDNKIPKPIDFQLLTPLIGNGLLISEGKKWYHRRKALTPAFHFQILEQFALTFSRSADVLVDRLKGTDSVEVTSYVLLCMLDAICETAMGVTVDAQRNPTNDYVQAFHDASRILFRQMANPLLKFDCIFKMTEDYAILQNAIKTIHGLTDRVIQDKREQLKSAEPSLSEEEYVDEEDEYGIKGKMTLIDILLKRTIGGKHLSDDDIKEEVNTFLFAGIDTTKSAISFLLYNIAKHQDVQKKLINEIYCYIHAGEERVDIEALDIHHLKYLDAVTKESMRLHTPVPVTGRQVTEEITINGLTVPKDTTVWVNIYGMCHDPNLFPNPGEFIPERFTRKSEAEKKTAKKVPTYSYIPFSAGPHICIGKRYALLLTKIIAVKLLLRYEIHLARPDEQLEYISEMVLKSKTGINLKFVKRQPFV